MVVATGVVSLALTLVIFGLVINSKLNVGIGILKFKYGFLLISFILKNF